MFNNLLSRLLLITSLFTIAALQPAFSADTSPMKKSETMKSTTSMKSTASSMKTNMTDKINVNTATAEQLATLKGIGVKKAQAIINYRKANGKFTDLEQLTNVKGIGDGILSKVTPFLKLK